MSSSETSSKRMSDHPSADEARIRLQYAYMVMIRSYLRRHQQAGHTPAASAKEAGDV